MTQPMEKYIWGVRQSNSLGGSSDAARCCQHRSNWFNYTHCQACGETMSSAGLMPTEARGNYLPKPTYLRETKTYHSQPLESTRHAGNYLYPAINTAHFYFLLQKLRQIT